MYALVRGTSCSQVPMVGAEKLRRKGRAPRVPVRISARARLAREPHLPAHEVRVHQRRRRAIRRLHARLVANAGPRPRPATPSASSRPDLPPSCELRRPPPAPPVPRSPVMMPPRLQATCHLQFPILVPNLSPPDPAGNLWNSPLQSRRDREKTRFFGVRRQSDDCFRPAGSLRHRCPTSTETLTSLSGRRIRTGPITPRPTVRIASGGCTLARRFEPGGFGSEDVSKRFKNRF